ncbi:DUF1877 family protein [Kitasatospora sp. NPDC059795]|uniref:DUF1877 family protein n=1 Tax=Kitasatospora sp. NPDC059795 TaxID=3346949 RepID=UPI0036563076
MSYHQHLRALPPSELVLDPGWLAEHMTAAWERLPEEYAAGVAHAVEKDFFVHALLYTGGSEAADDPSDVRTLPVFGGRPVFREDGEPPFAVMTPEQVARTAAYLAQADFDALWAAAGEQLGGTAADRDHLRALHEQLAAFYGRAAAAGHSVVKAFWF